MVLPALQKMWGMEVCVWGGGIQIEIFGSCSQCLNFGTSMHAWVKQNYHPIHNLIHALAIAIATIFTSILLSVFPTRKLKLRTSWSVRSPELLRRASVNSHFTYLYL